MVKVRVDANLSQIKQTDLILFEKREYNIYFKAHYLIASSQPIFVSWVAGWEEREREREISLFLRGYRYVLQDQDTTWPAAC